MRRCATPRGRPGIRLTLLDTCYLRGGIDVPLEGVQRRFDDGDAECWANRVSMLSDDDGFRVAAAVHSVRAVPTEQLDLVVEAAVGEDGMPRPLHVHLSEQPAENAGLPGRLRGVPRPACWPSTGCSARPPPPSMPPI